MPALAVPSERSGLIGSLPQKVRRDFSGIGYDEAMRRAREIVPILRERAQAAEDARMLIRENEQLLHETGLFRFHQPKAFGGMQLEFVALVDIAAEHATGGVTTDVVLHFLAPNRVGPVRATARPLGARSDGEVCRVEVRDEGGDRLTGLAVAVARATAQA